MKKRIIALLTCLILALSVLNLVACGEKVHNHTLCSICGNCTAQDCTGTANDKCKGHKQVEVKDPAILSHKSTPTSLSAMVKEEIPTMSWADSTTLHYIDENQEIPYLEGDDIVSLLNKLLETQIEVKTENKVVTLTRKNGSYVTLDFNNDTITWSEFNTFYNKDYEGALYDVTVYTENLKYLLKRFPDSDYIRPGHQISVKLKEDFNIEMVFDENTQKFYLPLATVNDVFLSDLYTFMYYNGEKIFIAFAGNIKDFENEYYSVQPRYYSKTFAEFNYNELLLALELHYGLKDTHDIVNFDDVLQISGLDKKLKSTVPLDVDNAIKEFICKYLDDLHSEFNGKSPYTSKNADLGNFLTPAHIKIEEAIEKYSNAYDMALIEKEIDEYAPLYESRRHGVYNF